MISNGGGLLIVDPTDPLGDKVGGITRFLKTLIGFAPDAIDIEMIGISSGPRPLPLKVWQTLTLRGRSFRFMPVLQVENENVRPSVPLSLTFTLELCRTRFAMDTARLILVNRFEPLVALRKYGGRKIVIVHNDAKQLISRSGDSRWSHMPSLYWLLERYLIRSVFSVYTVDEATTHFYSARYPNRAADVHLLSPGVDRSVFCPASVPRATIRADLTDVFPSLRPDEPWILFVGRLSAQKDPTLLLEAFAAYYQKARRGQLLIAGPGHLAGLTATRAAELNVTDRICFLGSLGDQRLANVYRAADLLLLVSRYEGTPLAVIEAIACGTPVVAVPLAGVERYVRSGYSGELTPNRDPLAIAAAIAQVANNPSLYQQERSVEGVTGCDPSVAYADLYDLALHDHAQPAQTVIPTQ